MRYTNIGDISFKNIRGERKTLKDLRPLVSYDSAFQVDNDGEFLDSVANKVYGDDSEPLWFRIADQNVKQLVARKFDLSKIKRYDVPVR